MRAVWSILGIGVMLGATGSAMAQSNNVRVVLGDRGVAEVQSVLQELLSRHPVTVEFITRERMALSEVVDEQGGEERLAHVWLTQRSPREVTVYIADGSVERILVRSVALEAETLDEIARETVGYIVEAAIEALLAGTPIGQPRAEVERSLGLEPAPPEPSDPVAASEPSVEQVDLPPQPNAAPGVELAIGAGYSVSSAGSGVLYHGPAIQLEVSVPGPLRLGGRLALQGILPTRSDSTVANLDLYGATIWIDGLLDIPLSDEWFLGTFAGAGVAILQADAVAMDPSFRPDAPSTNAMLQFRLGLGARFSPAAWPVAFRLEGWVLADPTDLHFVVQTPANAVSVFDPWLFQPGGRFSALFSI